jgi:hypothetical protein
MPGFMVGGIGGMPDKSSVSGRRQFYYNYTWDIESIFQDSPAGKPPLVCLRDASLPTFTVNKETYQGASLEYKFAKSVVWEDIKVSWYDSEGLLPIMKTWREMVWTPECGIKPPNLYKFDTILNHFLPTGAKQNQWKLNNSWPSQIRHGDLTYTSSEVKIIEVTVSYDWAIELPAS